MDSPFRSVFSTSKHPLRLLPVVLRVEAKGEDPGRNTCAVAIDINGTTLTIESEADGRTLLQAGIDGVANALYALPEACHVTIMTCSVDLASSIAGGVVPAVMREAILGGHVISVVHEPTPSLCNASATETVHG